MTEEERKRVEELLEEGEDEETEIAVGGVSGCGLLTYVYTILHYYWYTQLLLLGYKCL